MLVLLDEKTSRSLRDLRVLEIRSVGLRSIEMKMRPCSLSVEESLVAYASVGRAHRPLTVTFTWT